TDGEGAGGRRQRGAPPRQPRALRRHPGAALRTRIPGGHHGLARVGHGRVARARLRGWGAAATRASSHYAGNATRAAYSVSMYSWTCTILPPRRVNTPMQWFSYGSPPPGCARAVHLDP